MVIDNLSECHHYITYHDKTILCFSLAAANLKQGAHPVRSVESPLYSSALKNCSMRSSVDCQPSAHKVDENLSPASLDSVVAERDAKVDKYSSASAINSPECLEAGPVYSSFFLFFFFS